MKNMKTNMRRNSDLATSSGGGSITTWQQIRQKKT